MKSAHFLAVKTTYTVAQYAQMYLDSIVALQGVLVFIVSDKGPQFTRDFGRNFRKPWVLNWISVQPSILRQMGSQNGQFRLLRICSGCVLWISEVVGKNIYLW